MPIPKIIQQMWIGDQSIRPSRLMHTWQDKNPSCVYMLWTEENLKDFPFKNKKQIDAMGELNGKCDIMRYELLYKYGGIFLDADSECINPLDDFFFTDSDRWSCYENEQNAPDLISSGYHACKVGDEICGLAILELGKLETDGSERAWQICGNKFFASLISKWNNIYPTKIYPSWYFIPKHGTGLEYKGTDKIYSKHYWGSTFGLYETL